MAIKIRKSNDPQDWEKVTPNFIYNRFDLFCSTGEFETVRIQNGSETKVLEYRITGDQIELGIRLTPISEAELKHLLYYITRSHPNVKTIRYNDGVISCGKSRTHNYFRVVFPDTAEEMKKRVSAETWHRFRRRNRRAEEKYGKMQLLEYDRSNIPEEVVEAFFRFKLETRKRVYNMTPSEYLDRYHVSDCYVVKFGDTIGAMHFCCEQCPVVYGENHSYNPELKEYSLGKFIFAHSLVRMVEKKHTEIFLAGGEYEYKTHYGSIEETLYDCVIDVSELDFADLIAQNRPWGRCKRLLKAILARCAPADRKHGTQ